MRYPDIPGSGFRPGASRSSDRSFPLLRQRRAVSPARFGGDPIGLRLASADDPLRRVSRPEFDGTAPEGASLPRRTAGHDVSRRPLLPRCHAPPAEPMTPEIPRPERVRARRRGAAARRAHRVPEVAVPCGAEALAYLMEAQAARRGPTRSSSTSIAGTRTGGACGRNRARGGVPRTPRGGPLRLGTAGGPDPAVRAGSGRRRGEAGAGRRGPRNGPRHARGLVRRRPFAAPALIPGGDQGLRRSTKPADGIGGRREAT